MNRFLILLFFGLTIILYLPIILNPDLLFNRGNDLQEQFWPIFYFIRERFWETLSPPLWNNLWFSGMPLLSDPQFSLFYPGNYVFYLLPTDIALIVYFITHTFLSGIGAYLLAKYGLKLSYKASLFAGCLYIVTPKIAGYLEAGHLGLAGSLAWLPFTLLGVIKISTEKNLKWVLVAAIGLAGLFFTHTINFLVILFAVLVIFFILLLSHPSKKAIFRFLMAGLLTLGLTAITLLPQLEFLFISSRSLLLNSPDVYPKWTSKVEFLKSILIPWIEGVTKLQNLDTEKWIVIGLIPSILGLVGFIYLDKKLKVLVALTSILITLIALNNSSPFYSFLLSQDWYVLSRVSTRVWVITTTLAVFLATFGIDNLLKHHTNKKLVYLLVFLSIFESLVISWLRLNKPIPIQTSYVPDEVYQYLSSDNDLFRVFCVTRCLSQKQAAIYNLQLIEGYNPLQQKNYYNQFIQLSQVFWDKYTPVLPPFEIYTFNEIQPLSSELSDYNVKYIVSPYPLNDYKFELKKDTAGYLIYENTIVKKRAFFSDGQEARILAYTPNYIKIDTSSKSTNETTVSEVYSFGWIAKLDGNKPVPIIQTPNKLRQIHINPDTQFIEFSYQPQSYLIGKIITTSTITLLVIIFIVKKIKLSQFQLKQK